MTLQALVEELTVPVNTELYPTSLHIYQTLVCLVIEVAKGREYSPSVTQVTLHVPAEVIAFELGIHRSTLWRQLEPLVTRGLVEYRAHKTTLNGETRNDGTLWASGSAPQGVSGPDSPIKT